MLEIAHNNSSTRQRVSFSDERINVIRKRFQENEFINLNGISIYATGSFARKEACQHSDVDIFFLQDSEMSIGRIQKIRMDAEIIKLCSDMGFPEFSNDGQYLEVHGVDDLINNLGSQRDDYSNHFTARVLLLLESDYITNKDIFDRVKKKVIGAYFRDYHSHNSDFQPIFLVNDVLRYWRTLCLNYEHSRGWRGVDFFGRQKAHIRNLRLKFSRLLMCYSLVAYIIARGGSVGPDVVESASNLTPLKRLEAVSELRPEVAEIISNLFGLYEWFLGEMNRPKEQLYEWISVDSNRDVAFDKARMFSDLMYRLITTMPKNCSILKYLVV